MIRNMHIYCRVSAIKSQTQCQLNRMNERVWFLWEMGIFYQLRHLNSRDYKQPKSYKKAMDWQQDPSEEIQVFDEHSASNSFHDVQLQEYKDFKRPEQNLQTHRSGKQDVYLMGIDVTSTIKTVFEEGKKTLKPIIKIYAVNSEGNSYLVHVKQFVPYFYVPYPRGLINNPKNLDELRLAINKLFKDMEQSKHRKQYFDNKILTEQAITKLEPVHRINIRGYTPKERQNDQIYLKVHTCTPSVVAPLRNIFQRQLRVLNINLPRQTFESNIPYALRFMVDKGLGGMSWFKVKAGDYTVRTNQESSCQIEIDCSQSSIRDIKCEGQWSKLAPLRVLSFDIECAAEHGFPNAENHPIIQIACVCKTLASKQEEGYRSVIVLKGCSPISGVDVKETDDEKVLLQQFQKLIFSYDPDFIIGYNIINFDLSYILDRAAALKMKGYGRFGRSIGSISRIKKGTLQSKIMGNRQTKDINIEGRIQLDLLIHMHREHKLSSYSLNNVSYHFLRDQKEDVHHSQVYKLFQQSRDTRKRLAVYCLKDAELPLRLMEKLCCLYNYSEMARVTGVPMNFLLNRGQQIKVVSQLLRKARERDYILPTSRSKASDEKGFEGAYVLDPDIGYYKQPIATLDFASLYPSIMMAHNLCYTTLVSANQLEQLGLTKEDVTKTPQNYFFVTNLQKRRGILPEILMELISARKKAKRQLAEAKDEMLKNVLQGRQLALKVSANSVYGFTGATVGQLPCLQISSSVTAFGREMIDRTRNRVKELFPGSDVIYGDTDSVMVKFKLEESIGKDRPEQILESMKKGREAAALISKDFKAPIKLQFQKIYCPYLLMAKKRYVGVYYSSNHITHDKIDKKGFESVRRDNCYLIRQMLENILDLLLCKNDTDGISTYVKKIIGNLVQNKVDISKLVITKAISKNTEEEEEEKQGKHSGKSGKNTYKVKQAHVELAQKMQKRDENISLNIGDRISYVMIAGQKGSKNYENAEDPIRVLEQDLPIDYDYYIQKQIRPPLQRLLLKTGIFPNLQVLFAGDHTKNRYVPKINKNNLMGRFVTVFNTCINCPSKSQKALCQRCNGKALEIQVAKLLQFESFKAEYKDLWYECVNCQGSVTMEILCQNVDCPIYYKRIKIKNDLATVRNHMDKLNAHLVTF